MNQFTISDINRNKTIIPAKVRTTKPSPLYLTMDKLGIGHSITLGGVALKDVATSVYATAKRLGIKVTLRATPDGVNVWRIKNMAPATDREIEKEQPVRGRKAA